MDDYPSSLMTGPKAPGALVPADLNAQGGQIRFIQVIRSALAEQQIKNPNRSLRAFAKQLGVAPAELSLIFNSKRRVSRKMAIKILDRLAVDPATTQTLLEQIPAKLTRKKRAAQKIAQEFHGDRPRVSGANFTKSVLVPTQKKANYTQISSDEFNMIADWYYLAILSLAETDSFKSDVQWIANRLGIRFCDANAAIETLLRLGLLDKKINEKKTVLIPTGRKFATTQDVPSSSIRKNHAQALELARTALVEVPLELREFGGSIIVADPDLLPAAKDRLRELRREISQILESGSKKEVYRLSVQLIPLTKPV